MPLVIPPIGVSPLGQFVPAAQGPKPAPPPGVLADQVDWQTMELTSLVEGPHPIDEQVMTALTTVRNSGAVVTETGARFVDVDKLDQNAQLRLESECRIALKRLIERRDISFLGVDVETDDDWGEVTAKWKNLRARDADVVRTEKLRSSFNIAGSLPQ